MFYEYINILVPPSPRYQTNMNNHSTNVDTENQSESSRPSRGEKEDVASRDLVESLRKRFEIHVTISIFSASVIVGFGSLIHNLLVESARNRRLFDVGLLVSFFIISCHIFIIAISGRCSASLHPDNQITTDDIKLLLFARSTCDHLYMVAIYLFSATLLMMSFVVFENVAYPAAYCGTVALGIVILFSSRLKRLMVLYKLVKRISGTSRV